jgi:hypothetical protein
VIPIHSRIGLNGFNIMTHEPSDKLYVYIIECENGYRIGICHKDPNDLMGDELDDMSFFVDEDYRHNTKINNIDTARNTQLYIMNILRKATNNVVPYK